MAKAKYKKWLQEDNLLRLQGWARDGLIDEQIAHNMGIAISTLHEWKKKYPELSESLKTSKEVVDIQVENALFKNAMGYDYTEVKEIIEKDEQGKDRKRIERYHKKMPPNTTAQIFWLKNRKPAEWRDRQEVDNKHSFDGSGNFTLKIDGKKINGTGD
jgi:hypothetical protein